MATPIEKYGYNHLYPADAMAGGLASIQFLPYFGIRPLPDVDPITGILPAVALTPGFEWVKTVTTPGKRGYNERSAMVNGNPTIIHEVNCFLPYDNIANHYSLSHLVATGQVLKVNFTNGITRIVGNERNDAQMQIVFESGESYKGTAGRFIKWLWTSESVAPILAV